MGNLSWKLVYLHKDNCGTPSAVKRLYIRERTNYKQKFVPCGVICCCCGAFELDKKWILENEQEFEEIKQRIPRQRRQG